MVQHQQLSDTLVADAVLAWQDQRMGEQLLADRTDQLPLNVFDRDLDMETWRHLLKTTSRREMRRTFRLLGLQYLWQQDTLNNNLLLGYFRCS